MSVIEQYKAYLLDVGNIGARYEASRRFYFALLSAFFVFLSYAGAQGPFDLAEKLYLGLVCWAGVALCGLWFIHMRTYKAIFLAKFTVLQAIENQHNLFHAFEYEWQLLGKDKDYWGAVWTDSWPPWLFAALILTITALPFLKDVL